MKLASWKMSKYRCFMLCLDSDLQPYASSMCAIAICLFLMSYVCYWYGMSTDVLRICAGMPFQVGMATPRAQVTIPFRPLLLQIVGCLDFLFPVYTLLDAANNNVLLSVAQKIGTKTYYYIGGRAHTIDDSCEKAAHQAVIDLMAHEIVTMKDVTYSKVEAFKRCASLYKLKCNGLSSKKSEANFTPVETVEHDRMHFTSWMTLGPPKSTHLNKCIFGDCCLDLDTAKTNMAAKAIDFLIDAYNIEIVNVNYNSMDATYAPVACSLQREDYFAIKQRVLGMTEENQPTCLLMQQECTTPRGITHQIPTMDGPPLPPRKRQRRLTMGDKFPFYPGEAGTSGLKRKRVSRRQSQIVNNSIPSDATTSAPKKKLGRPRLQRQTSVPAATIGMPLPEGQLNLPITESCNKCGARRIYYESRNFCCGYGTIVLPSNTYPPQLNYLYTSGSEGARHFQKYSRTYNNMFAYSSIGGTFDAKSYKGIYVFKLYGQIYHYVPDLLPSDGGPRYLQLYFYDGQQEAERRAGCFSELRRDVVDMLMEVTSYNPYAKFFRSLREMDILDNTKILINKSTSKDQRVYNAPTSNEVAVIWPDTSATGHTDGPHITVTGKTQASHRIMHYYGCYDPLQYPLLFPYGECGWHQGLKKSKPSNAAQPVNISSSYIPVNSCENAESLLEGEASRSVGSRTAGEKNISCREYYCYKLQNRPSNMLLRAGRCYQQYVVDMYVKLENTRLDYFRHNQDTIRSELYQGLLDTVDAGESLAANVGRRVILPATYIKGPRDMKKRYLNAMSLVQRHGKPDLFVTMTCNANWPEIKRELSSGEEAQNRPDIVVRVFRAKLIAFKKQVTEKHIFGELATLIYVVEFQKRGLPHAHFLIILKKQYKMNCPADFDRFVSAEIPPLSQPAIRKAVLKHMMHGPCRKLDAKCPCMTHMKTLGVCKYGFPKKFTDETTNNSDGYPVYRRRDTRESAKIRSHMLDNRWVIPYNPYLMMLFDCHLNVEVCSTIQAVKYLYKYVYKGHDKISFNVAATGADSAQAVDEIQQFQSVRWVSPCEAIWRIFGFDLFEIQPAEAALKLRLLENDDTVDLCLDEAVEAQMPVAIRRLFATILIFCQPKDPNTLWTKYYEHLSEDFSKQFPTEASKVQNLTYRAVERILEAMGKTMKAFGLNHLCTGLDNEIRRTRDIIDALDAPIPEECVASSNIPSGRTAHSRFKIPVDLDSSRSCDVPKQGSLAGLLREASLLIWDEASMARKENVEALDELLRDLCDLEILFGGKLIVFGGDFRQILPVVPQQSNKEVVDCSLVASKIWPKLTKFKLTENIRARQDPNFSRFLLSLGNGERQTLENEYIELHEGIVRCHGDQKHELINTVTDLAFTSTDLQSFDPAIFKSRAILTPMNDDVDAVNSILISRFPGTAKTYKSYDTVLDDQCNIYPTEFINKLCPGGMSLHELILKPESPVILLRNLLPSSGLCNGTRMICKTFYNNLIECVITAGHHAGEHVFIPRINLRPPATTNYPFQFQKKQFPIKLSFAMTINKSQGQTLDKVAIYLPRPCFSPGQLYVALSRAREANKVTVISAPPPENVPQNYVKNICLRAAFLGNPSPVARSVFEGLNRGLCTIRIRAMKAEKVHLDELTGKSRNYKVKGHKMRAALFGEQVEMYKEAIVYNGNYEIVNAPIKPMDERWKKDASELNYQMSFGRQTIVQPMDIETGPVEPEYMLIGRIPKAGDLNEKFDVLAVVLVVEDKPRNITLPDNRELKVAEIAIIDHRAARNTSKLMETKARILQARRSATNKIIVTIAALRGKKASGTLPDDRFWLRVTVLEATLSKVNAYLGCSQCGARSNLPAGARYSCKRCSKEECISIARVTFSCDVSDGTWSLPITAFTGNAETLFQMAANDIFQMKCSDNAAAFEVPQALLRTKPLLIEVAPKTSLAISNILEWVLRQVIIETIEVVGVVTEFQRQVDKGKGNDATTSSLAVDTSAYGTENISEIDIESQGLSLDKSGTKQKPKRGKRDEKDGHVSGVPISNEN
ncbi:hypothetical protein KSS87_020327 [Heliosperma pusillum]|nr:hypothetical protein KSS87_020327 [Heliosperma pusillum]